MKQNDVKPYMKYYTMLNDEKTNMDGKRATCQSDRIVKSIPKFKVIGK